MITAMDIFNYTRLNTCGYYAVFDRETAKWDKMEFLSQSDRGMLTFDDSNIFERRTFRPDIINDRGCELEMVDGKLEVAKEYNKMKTSPLTGQEFGRDDMTHLEISRCTTLSW